MENDKKLSVEYEPVNVANFAEVARDLPESVSLLVSRNRVYPVDGEKNWGAMPIQYEGLNDMSVYDSLGDKEAAPLVTDEFLGGALRVLMDDAENTLEATVYPRLTVINADTQAMNRVIVDVAELIIKDEVEVEGEIPGFQGGAEELNISMETIARKLAEDIGVPVERAVVVGLHTPQSLNDRLPRASLRVGGSEVADDLGVLLDQDTRGAATVRLMQMAMAEAFRDNPYKTTPLVGEGLEVELLLQPLPDMQGCMLDMIDTVEARGNMLCCKRRMLPGGEMGYEFTLVDDQNEELMSLYGNPSLLVALYGAAQKVKDFFPPN